MEVEIRDLQPVAVDHDLLRRAAELAAELAGESVDRIELALVDDRRIAQVNRSFRGTDGPTDVIAFEAEPGPEGLAGDIVVSVESAQRQAEDYRHSLQREMCLLVAHGVLHALGHDDESESGAGRMRELQDAVLAGLEEFLTANERR